MILVHLFLLFFLFSSLFIIKYGYTALMFASKKGYFEIVKLLIENNADVNFQNKVFFFNFL
jgi:ankyrin repeat protein